MTSLDYIDHDAIAIDLLLLLSYIIVKLTMAIVTSRSEASGFAHRFAYDVFLSFRGEDTRKTFTDHLHAALVRQGFRTFRDDDNIARGEAIKSELREAIRRSRISIVVFSRGYATSTWCLDELVAILESKRSGVPGYRVLPVYYDVDSSEVRRQNGSVAAAFEGYEARIEAEKDEGERRRWRERVDEWKMALSEATDLAGMELRNHADGYEAKFIQKIVDVIQEKLNRSILSGGGLTLVGIHLRVKNIIKWLQDGSNDVGVIGICGMGGIGKTTIAKFVYNMNFKRFEGSCFLANVREVSEQSGGLLRLQRQLLSNILMTREKISNIDEGIMKIKNVICCTRVLLVLDDVDQVEQLDAFLRMRTWFHPGSKIIITTRYKQLLKTNQVNDIHEVNSLNGDESLALFSWHAFGQNHPHEEYQECSNKVVAHCGGLPLALRVIGSSLFGKGLEAWESAIQKFEEFPHSQVHEKLTISYESLQDDHDKKLFLYIACFFVGKDEDSTVIVLDGCDFYTKIGIENLIDRSLLTVDEGKNLGMHQLLQDMGREINRRQSPEPGKRSIVWHHKDSYRVLKEKSGTDTVEGLALDMRVIKEKRSTMNKRKRPYEESIDKSLFSGQGNPNKWRHSLGFFWNFSNTSCSNNLETEDLIEADAFARMCKLKVLKLTNVQMTECYKEFPKRLRWVCWHGFNLSCLPKDFPLESLIELELPHSRLEQIWKGSKFLGALKSLDLSHSHQLIKTPSFTGLPNLERLILKDCICLVCIHESIVNVERLVFLNLEDCKRLRNLPRDFGKIKYMETLIISGCSNLEALPIELGQMEYLKVFHADGISINNLVSTSRGVKPWHIPIPVWVSLRPRINPTNSWVSLPRSLVTLSLVKCSLSDDSFPRDLCNLPSLTGLFLGENKISRLPDFVKGLPMLQYLCVSHMPGIQALTGVPATMHRLYLVNCSSLESITFASPPSGTTYFHHAHLDELAEIEGSFKFEPIENVDIRMINSFGLNSLGSMATANVRCRGRFDSCEKERPIQGLYEFGIFSIFLPDIEVPSSFSYRSKESMLSITVPSLTNNITIKGLNVCIVYALSGKDEFWSPSPLFCQVGNTTKDLTWAYFPERYGIPEANQDMVWLSFWNFGNQLEPGNKLDVSIIVGDGFQVKECAIELVYNDHKEEEDAQQQIGPFAWKRVIGGDLSRFQLIAGKFYLCRHQFKPSSQILGENHDSGNETSSDWIEKLFGGSVDCTLLKASVMSTA